MDWLSKKSWDKEDKLYSPKRTVNNKGSRTFEHVIGSLPSKKMDRHIPVRHYFITLLSLIVE